MAKNFQTAADIVARLRAADADEFSALERMAIVDTRKTVQHALQTARRRIDASRAEEERVKRMYDYQETLAQGRILVGLDEVGRGPLAGPLTVGAVVLPPEPLICGINDSKQLSAAARIETAARIKQVALAEAVVHIPAEQIDQTGMSICLGKAFSQALNMIEDAGIHPEVVLIDGNPVHIDAREINVIKGDAKCASIGAASILAKVERDALMIAYAAKYPLYDFEHNKGYGSEKHYDAIRAHGLSPIHRRSFCTSFLQERLF